MLFLPFFVAIAIAVAPAHYSLLDQVNEALALADGIKVAVAIDLGGAYLSSREHNDKYSVFVKKMKAFASRTAAQAMNDKIATEKKIFAALEKDQKNLIKEKEKKEKDIVDAKKEIEDSEKKLVENKSNTEAKSKELAVQKEKMAGLEELLRSIK